MEPPQAKTPATSVVLALSAFLLGLAMHINDGLYSPAAFWMMAAAFVLCLIAVLGTFGEIRPAGLEAILAGLALLQLLVMPFKPAGASSATVATADQTPFQVGTTLAAVAVLMIAFAPRRLAGIGFAMILVLYVGIGTWKIRTAPDPRIDVFIFHKEAAEAMTRGENPYAMTFTNPYNQAESWVYGPGLAKDGRLLFGYPYPPIVLFATTTSQRLLHDSRYAMLMAIALSGLILVAIRPGRIGMLLAALLLFTPRSFYVLEMAWTEPISILLLVATVFCLMRAPLSAPVPLGILIASKQYLPLGLLLTPLTGRQLASRRAKFGWITGASIAVGVALVTALPAAWGFHAFWESLVHLQLLQPYRRDALSFLAWWGSDRPEWTGPIWVAFAAFAIAAALSIWRRASFAKAFALCFFAFFAFNKQAFANYYDLVLGAICCGIACENWSCEGKSADKQIIGPCAGSSPSSSPS